MSSRQALVFILACGVAVPPALHADFQYSETSRITGGSIVSLMKVAGAFSKQARQTTQPTTSTVIVKGNRQARIGQDMSEIIDLDKETITTIDNTHKTYSVVTFQEMKQQMEEAARNAREKQKQAEKNPQQESAAKEPPPQMSFDVKVRNTGAAKQVAGLDARESILTMTMIAKDQKTGESGNLAITNDMYMVPEIPGYAEVREFERKFALKMGTVFSPLFTPQMAAMRPGSAQGMMELGKEMSKLKGVPVYQVMRLGSTANGQPLPAASEAALPESNSPEMPSAGEVAKESAASAITSKLGGFGLGGFGKKKKKEEQKQQEQAQTNQAGQNFAVLLQTEIETTSFSSAPVDTARFEVPLGYKQVQGRSASGE